MTTFPSSISKTSYLQGKAQNASATHTQEAKYDVTGATLDGAPGEAGVKIGFTDKLVVITVYFC